MPKPVNSNHALILFNPLIGPLLGITTLCQSGPGSEAMKGYSAFHKAPALR